MNYSTILGEYNSLIQRSKLFGSINLVQGITSLLIVLNMMSSFVVRIIGGHSQIYMLIRLFIQISVCNRMNVNVNVDVFTTCYIESHSVMSLFIKTQNISVISSFIQRYVNFTSKVSDYRNDFHFQILIRFHYGKSRWCF